MLIYGIDVSKSYLDIYTEKEEKGFSKRISNKPRAIVKFLEELSEESVLCAEFTGVYTELLVQFAYCKQVKIALVSPFTLSRSMGDRKGKSDKTDAKRIWEYASRFTDKLAFIAPKDQVVEELSELMNLRNQLVKQRKMLLTSQKTNKHKPVQSIVRNHITDQTIGFLSEQIREIEKQMLEALEYNQQCKVNVQLITSVKGVGNITAFELLIKSENFTKIDTARKAAAYAGVCPYLNESGNVKKKPKVHPRSDKRLKSVLYLAAVSACLNNKEFRHYKERKTMEGKHYFLVMNNVSNKLLRLIYAVVKSGQPYDSSYLALDPRN